MYYFVYNYVHIMLKAYGKIWTFIYSNVQIKSRKKAITHCNINDNDSNKYLIKLRLYKRIKIYWIEYFAKKNFFDHNYWK